MRSSDTPENEHDDELDPELVAEQGPADWSGETPSDDRLAPEVRRRLEQAARRDAAGVNEELDEGLVDKP